MAGELRLKTILDRTLVVQTDREVLPSWTVVYRKIDRIPEELWAVFHNIKKIRAKWILDRFANSDLKTHPTNDILDDFYFIGSDYNDEKFRKYYITKFMTSYVQVFFNCLNDMYSSNRCYREWLERRKVPRVDVRVVSIGGGPGTDLFALEAHLRYLENNNIFSPDLGECIVMDNCLQPWNGEFDVLNTAGKIESGRLVKMLNKVEIKEIDVAVDDDNEVESLVKVADILIISKIFSSVTRHEEDLMQLGTKELKHILIEMFDWMKNDSIILYMDTKCREHRLPVDKAAKRSSFDLMYSMKADFKAVKSVIDGIDPVIKSDEKFNAYFKPAS